MGVEGELEGYEDASGYGDDGSSNAFPTDSKDYFDPTEQRRKEVLEKWIYYDDETQRHTCSLCKMAYTTKNQNDGYRILLNHLEAKHLRIKGAYPCHYCERGFFSKHQRTNHIYNTHRDKHKLSTKSSTIL